MATSLDRITTRRVLVVPLIRVTPSLEMLSYSVPEGLEIFPGACVEVPFRTKAIVGIVWAEERAEAREGTKPIIGRKGNLCLTPEQMRIAKWLHAETLTPRNVILRSMVLHDGAAPHLRRRGASKVSLVACPTGSARQEVLTQWSKRIAANADRTLIVVPNQGAAAQWLALLVKLRPLHIVPPRSSAAQQRLRNDLRATNTFITTHVGLLYPLPQIDRVILDLADDEGYFAFDQAPRVDVRRLAVATARTHGSALLVLTRWMSPTVTGLFPDVTPTTIGANPAVTLIDRQGEPLNERGHLPPTYLIEKLQHTRTLWLHTRASEAGRYVCADCGAGTLCPTCGKALRVTTRHPLILECLYDHLRIEAPSTCAVCKGTRLSTRAPGVQQVARTIADLVGAGSVATLERGVAQGDLRQALHVVSTTAIGSHPTLIFDAAVLLQPDSYLAQPGYRSAEQFFSTLALAKAAVAKHGSIFVVTHKPEIPAYQFLSTPTAWSQQALQEREALRYPPAGTLVLLQPRKRMLRAAAQPLQAANVPSGTVVTHLGASWMFRATSPRRDDLLQWLQQHLDPTWEAIVDPPALPLD